MGRFHINCFVSYELGSQGLPPPTLMTLPVSVTSPILFVEDI